MPRRPAAHNPVIWRKVAAPAGTRCTELRAGAACDGFIPAGGTCDVCAFERAYVLEFIGYPDDNPPTGEWGDNLSD